MSKQPKQKEQKQEVSKSSNDVLGDILKQTQGDHFVGQSVTSQVISTGSLKLDTLCKIRSGGVVRITGKGSEVGKTSEAFVLAHNYMRVMPKSKTIYVKAEGRLSEEMQGRAGHNFVFSPETWDYGTVFVYPCNIFETVAVTLERLLKVTKEADEHLCIIIDSLDGLMLREDSKKDIFGDDKQHVKVAGVPLLTKILFRRLALPLHYSNALLIITSQYSAEIKLDPYSPNIPRQASGAGGSSISHQCDYCLEISPRYPGDYILENDKEKPDFQKNKIIGVWATYDIRKSGTDVSGNRIRIPVKKGRIGNAIWREMEIAEMMPAWGMISKSGSWLSFSEDIRQKLQEFDPDIPEKIQGEANLRSYLEQHQTVTDYLFDWFRENACS